MTSQFNPEARRNTPLARELKQRIEADGPISVEAYVQACLYDPIHGYYVSRPAIGQASDFITAPEISQIFGELLGIWTILTWQQIGSPSELNVIELGPGRGTMMADIVRSLSKVAELSQAIGIHLIDTNAVLRAAQKATLAGAPFQVSQHESLQQLAEALADNSAPCIVLANEFVDALGVRQRIVHAGQWCERTVELSADGELRFSVGEPVTGIERAAASDGTIWEDNPSLSQLVQPFLVALARKAPLATVFIDYGYTEPAVGETLQAMRAHAYEHPLTSPGEADLTAHVDFTALAQCLAATGLTIDGPTPQAEFLGRLGIVERTSQLMAGNPAQAAAIETGTMRLLAPNGMGTRFQVLAARNWSGTPMIGFDTTGRTDRSKVR